MKILYFPVNLSLPPVMRYFCLFVLQLSCCCVFAQAPMMASLEELRQTKQQAVAFDQQKQATIDSIKKNLKPVDELPLAFDNYLQLYEEYKAFKYDSAYSYARKLQQVALQLNDHHRMAQARLKLSFSLVSAGLFKEAADSLNLLTGTGMHDSLRMEYYQLMGRLYYDLADFTNDSYHTPGYVAKGNHYLDSAIRLCTPGSFQHAYFSGLKDIRSGNNERALLIYNQLMKRPQLTNHEIALTASTLSDIYIQNQQNDSAIALLIKAAIADIRSSTKETAAAFNLANLLYKKGDVKNASSCIELAISDATFYGARQRKVKVSDILPLIESEKLGLVEKQKKTLVTYAVIVTLLLLGLIGLTIVVFRQVNKLKAAKKLITEAHLKEQEINHRLSVVNNKLSEANKIKEEYIGYFFNVNSEFFDKIERFKRSLEQKVNDRKLEEIRFLVNNINLRAEKEYLLQNFDRVFLKLFPNFVAEFNTLFSPENQIALKEGELLNTDLRIFALIRMGIHDNEKIARILQYSVNTINTYKTKIKKRSLVTNEEFEKKIMEIKTV
jgi:DNA-binding CsgD family transcriptional regulator